MLRAQKVKKINKSRNAPILKIYFLLTPELQKEKSRAKIKNKNKQTKQNKKNKPKNPQFYHSVKLFEISFQDKNRMTLL